DKFSNHTSSWKVTAEGPVLTTFECPYEINDVDYIQRITVYNQLKKIDFEYEIPNWKGVKSRQLSFALPINSNTATISYDVPMGIATVYQSELQARPGGWGWDGTYAQKPEEIHPRESQNFVTASSKNFGLTLSSSLAVFDWIDPTRDAVRYPVLQAVMLTSQKSCHGEGPWYFQKGKHIFRFSITSHQPGWKNGFAFGIGNNHAVYSISPVVDKKGVLPEQLSFFQSSSPYSLITAIKKADGDDEVIVRVVNMDNKAVKNTIKLFKNIHSLKKSSLIEEIGAALEIHGNDINIPLNKSSIETFKIGLINKNNKLTQ
ncbi:MAG: alpha-mannosidase, partial [Ferruginibacter sp.]|nr:alpha-mannosidase [Ferruginibacter sp.]